MIKLKSTRPGKKAPTSNKPELVLTPTFNKFTLNGIATELMGLESGQTVTISEDEDATSMTDRFYISKGYGDDVAKATNPAGATGTGNSLSFNYAGVYSRMLQENPTAPEASAKDLAEAGLVHGRETEKGNTSYSAAKTLRFKLGEMQELEVDEAGNTLEVYPLMDVKVEDYTPKHVGESTDTDAEAV